MKISINTTTRGIPVGKPINDAKALLKDMASNNCHWHSKHGNPRKGGRDKVDVFTMLASIVNALF